MNIERTELVLKAIDKLGVVSVQQLYKILGLGSYRYTCKIVQDLEPYLNVDRTKKKVVYLNKKGRDFIGSNREVKKSLLLEHMLLTNEVYIYYGCPISWKREYVIHIGKGKQGLDFIQVKGLKLVTQEKIICDAFFERNGYGYIIEVDNIRDMKDNRKKIERYLEKWPEIRKQFQNPRLCIFTKSEQRKKTFRELLRNVPNEVYLFEEI